MRATNHVSPALPISRRKLFETNLLSYPHIYGIDLASSNELIAFSKSESEIATAIGADRVIYQTLPDLKDACAEASPLYPEKKVEFECGVFTGDYVTGIETGYLDHLEQLRGDRKRAKKALEARHKFANGLADGEDLKLVAQQAGTGVTRPMPCGADRDFVREQREHGQVNGEGRRQAQTQDPSVHNLSDYSH